MDVLKKRLLTLALYLGLLGITVAQDKKFEPLSIDRPDVSNLPTTVLPGHYQFELGTELGQSDYINEFSVPNLLLHKRQLPAKTVFKVVYALSEPVLMSYTMI